MILIVGGTGASGGVLARTLIRRGKRIRVLTRFPAEPAAKALRRLGADIVQGNLLVRRSLSRIFHNIEGAYLVTTSANGLDEEVESGINFVDAAQSHGLQHLIFQSTTYADTQLLHCATKGKIEKYLMRSGVPYTTLRPGIFLDMLFEKFLLAFRNRSPSTAASHVDPDMPLFWIAVLDIAHAAARVLEHNKPRNKTYDLVSPVSASHQQIARCFSRSARFGCRFSFQPISVPAFLQRILNPRIARKHIRQLRGGITSDYYAGIPRGNRWIKPYPFIREFALRVTSPYEYARLVAEYLGRFKPVA